MFCKLPSKISLETSDQQDVTRGSDIGEKLIENSKLKNFRSKCLSAYSLSLCVYNDKVKIMEVLFQN